VAGLSVYHDRYDPRAIVTEGGAMKITLSRDQNHDLNYTGGLVNTWNKFCFTEGYVEGKPTDLSR
jgi:beta-glucanase (GH16 family)